MILVDAKMPIRCGVCRFPKVEICNRSAMPDMSGKNKCPIIAEIPNNATNGEVIKALFPCMEVRLVNKGILVQYTLDGIVGNTVTIDWWNSPYRKE